jgi:hypothetical protein
VFGVIVKVWLPPQATLTEPFGVSVPGPIAVAAIENGPFALNCAWIV